MLNKEILIKYFEDGITEKGHEKIGTEHMGGTASLLLSYARPDLVSQLILIDPVILSYSYRIIYKFLQKAGLMKIHPMVRGALMRRNTWKNQNEAVEYFERKKLFRNISKNIIEDYVTDGLRKNIHQKYELSCHPEWEAANFRLSPDEIGFNLKKSNIPIKLILPPNSYVCNKDQWLVKIFPLRNMSIML